MVSRIEKKGKKSTSQKTLLRDISFALAIIAIAFALGVQTLPGIILSTLDNLAAVISADLTSLTNTDRSANSLATFRVSPLLQKAAQLKADDMVSK